MLRELARVVQPGGPVAGLNPIDGPHFRRMNTDGAAVPIEPLSFADRLRQARFEQVTTIGVDEHTWRHTRTGDRYVTVVIDLTPIRNGTGPARLLDMAQGRSTAVFSAWLAARPQAWLD